MLVNGRSRFKVGILSAKVKFLAIGDTDARDFQEEKWAEKGLMQVQVSKHPAHQDGSLGGGSRLGQEPALRQAMQSAHTLLSLLQLILISPRTLEGCFLTITLLAFGTRLLIICCRDLALYLVQYSAGYLASNY